MKPTTLLLMALAVGGLLFLAKRQLDHEAEHYEAATGERILEGVTADDVVELRFDHVERAKQMAFERRDGAWYIVDPIEYPADPSMVGLILQALAGSAEYVPDDPVELERVAGHFDPPSAVLTAFTEGAAGERREHRLEIGALDADGMRVEARLRGRYVRILRNIDTALDRTITEFRSKRLFTLEPDQVIEVVREGAVYDGPAVQELGLHMQRAGSSWTMRKPHSMALDPLAAGLWVNAVIQARVRGFASDVPDPILRDFGLENPSFLIRARDAQEREEVLLVGQPAPGRFSAMIQGRPTIVEFENSSLARIVDPPEELYDQRLVRAFRRDIGHIEVWAGERVLRLTQPSEGEWTVAEQLQGQSDFGMDVPADVARVEDLLSAFEGVEVLAWLNRTGDEPSTHFPPNSPRVGVWFALQGILQGERQGGRLGETITSPEGSELRTFLRDGDGRVGLVPVELYPWTQTTLDDWRSRAIWTLEEVTLKQLAVTELATDVSRTFLREIQGTWRYSDVEATASELFPVLDSLFFLKAQGHDAPDGPLTDAVRVEFRDNRGETHLVELGRAPDGRVLLSRLGLRSIAKDQELLDRLLEIVQRKR